MHSHPARYSSVGPVPFGLLGPFTAQGNSAHKENDKEAGTSDTGNQYWMTNNHNVYQSRRSYPSRSAQDRLSTALAEHLCYDVDFLTIAFTISAGESLLATLRA
jgi:hypothetical protein